MSSLALRRLLVLSGLGCLIASWAASCTPREYSVTPDTEPDGGQSSANSGGAANTGGRTASGGTVASPGSLTGGTASGGAEEQGGASAGAGGTSNGGTSNGGTTAGGAGGLAPGGTTASGGTTGDVTSCTSDANCANNVVSKICDVAHKICVACIPGETACGTGQFCSPEYTCRVGCAVNSDCSTGSCDVALNRCIGCATTADCGGPAGMVECDTANQVCIEKGCKSTAACRTGFTCASGSCKNLTADKYNCGTSDYVCSNANGTASCSSSKCAITCNSGYDNCHTDTNDGCETNLTTDAEHCSSCTNACTTGQLCSAKACVTPSPCLRYCANPKKYTLKGGNAVLSGTSFCFEAVGTLLGGSCGNFAAGQRLYVNDVDMTCVAPTTSWVTAKIPTPVYGGYCIHDGGTASGGISAWFSAW